MSRLVGSSVTPQDLHGGNQWYGFRNGRLSSVAKFFECERHEKGISQFEA